MDYPPGGRCRARPCGGPSANPGEGSQAPAGPGGPEPCVGCMGQLGGPLPAAAAAPPPLPPKKGGLPGPAPRGPAPPPGLIMPGRGPAIIMDGSGSIMGPSIMGSMPVSAHARIELHVNNCTIAWVWQHPHGFCNTLTIMTPMPLSAHAHINNMRE
eukprot:1160886-Pelagomonas_calceolata.AAC.2